ncbi:transposase, MuDR, plant [Tanacetum coccineum]|uniref:Transposase, MuDR, plant n=1 Tax=Tanacetum coccineum TaxID=301880 RepID=A0ABQ5J428_9ASTR
MSVNSMPDGKNYFSRFYVCFKGLKEGWLQGCRRVIGIDGCFLKTICKGELLSAVVRDGNNQIYPIAWVVVNVENKENWIWVLLKLQNRNKEAIAIAENTRPTKGTKTEGKLRVVIEWKYTEVQYRNLFWKAAKATYPTRFEKVMKEIQSIKKEAYKHLMDRQPKSWSSAYFTIDKACDAMENGISKYFNALIVDARRRPIINMLEDIRIFCMERLQKMREKHEKWNDGICPNIRKKLEKYKDLYRFEVRNGYEGFKVDERARICSYRGWKLSGIPCEHGIASIYFLHRDPENYVSAWYNKDVFVNAYNHFIEGMNEMDQWSSTAYQKPLPPIKKRMPGRPPHKRKRDAMKDDKNRTRISRKGQLNHCTLCKKTRHNQKACPIKPEGNASVGEVTRTGEIISASVGVMTTSGEIVYASGGNVSASGEITSARGGNVSARGGKVSATGGKVTAKGGIVTASRGNISAKGRKVIVSGGKVTAKGGNVFARGENVSTRGGKVCARGGNVSARGGKVSATPSTSPCTPPPGFEMSTPDTAISVVRSSGGAIKLREGVWIRSPKKEWSSYVDFGSSSMNKLRTINGKVVSSSGKGDGSKSRMYPNGIRPIGFGVSWDPIDGQTIIVWVFLDMHGHKQQQPRRKSERIAQIMFNKPPSPGPGLDPDDAISLE